MRTVLPAILVLAACGGPAPEPPKPADPSGCDLTIEKLPGTSWVHLKPQPSGPEKPSPITRVRFRDEGGALVADYTASSLSAVYVYDCRSDGKIATCVERDLHAVEWCRAHAAANGGTCDATALAGILKVDPSTLTAAAESVNKEVAALKGTERDETLKSWNYPNNKIRGLFKVAVDKQSCRLTLQDKYQTMVDGKVQEYENQIGTAKFEQTKETYLFEDCKDVEGANTILPEGATARAYPAGTYEFVSGLAKDQVADAACTYTADVWYDWLQTMPDQPGTVEGKAVKWSVKVPVSGTGPHVVHFQRTRTCGGAEESLGVSCAKIHIE